MFRLALAVAVLFAAPAFAQVIEIDPDTKDITPAVALMPEMLQEPVEPSLPLDLICPVPAFASVEGEDEIIRPVEPLALAGGQCDEDCEKELLEGFALAGGEAEADGPIMSGDTSEKIIIEFALAPGQCDEDCEKELLEGVVPGDHEHEKWIDPSFA